MKRESKSFIDSLYAILTAADLFSGPKYMLSGLSGMAFKFSVHEQLWFMSVSAYGEWGTVHQPAVDNLGLFTSYDGGRNRHPTFRYYQQDAVQWIKASLDQGIGVIYWIPEFGVIHGYDDEDEIFWVQNGVNAGSQVVLYDNLGINSTPFWYVQMVGGKVEVPVEVAILEAIRMAIDDWDTDHILSNASVATGRMAYTFLIRALNLESFDEKGAVYILRSYQYSRSEIRDFLQEACLHLGGLQEALSSYDQLNEIVVPVQTYMIMQDGHRKIDRRRIPELVEILIQATALEEEAMRVFRHISSQYPDPIRSTVPRWGKHTPR
ncbi:hypothetical protein JCM16418_3783 [Paenibacillus pini JCM 16418]|uniref:Uncharacterized protein n=2 Tax=Paenibacillus TaxID=44249 RepID=W7YMG4_9BACL|nr:hypothetical protein JCM16418_3783 [Paenibacillus pini JCM 16418]